MQAFVILAVKAETVTATKGGSYEYAEKTLYKDRKRLQWCKEGLASTLEDIASQLMLIDNFEDLVQLLKSTQMDVETVLDAVETLECSIKYFTKKEEEQ